MEKNIDGFVPGQLVEWDELTRHQRKRKKQLTAELNQKLKMAAGTDYSANPAVSETGQAAATQEMEKAPDREKPGKSERSQKTKV